ncbi:hypothetical protein [Corynebacterium sp. A21]|uniref:hypothetical protein n=1 Tax=Corynebacterium sp. A21 TaxID=3457318 RepID=UPI003FD63E97
MIAATTIALADSLIAGIVGTDTRHYETTAPGHYVLGDITVEDTQEATAVDILMAFSTWAAETLDDMGAAAEEVDIATAICTCQFSEAIDLIGRPGTQSGLQIWDTIGLRSSR